MSESTLTEKGQTTVPKKIRQILGIKAMISLFGILVLMGTLLSKKNSVPWNFLDPYAQRLNSLDGMKKEWLSRGLPQNWPRKRDWNRVDEGHQAPGYQYSPAIFYWRPS